MDANQLINGQAYFFQIRNNRRTYMIKAPEAGVAIRAFFHYLPDDIQLGEVTGVLRVGDPAHYEQLLYTQLLLEHFKFEKDPE